MTLREITQAAVLEVMAKKPRSHFEHPELLKAFGQTFDGFPALVYVMTRLEERGKVEFAHEKGWKIISKEKRT